jgi:hypothetical protein
MCVKNEVVDVVEVLVVGVEVVVVLLVGVVVVVVDDVVVVGGFRDVCVERGVVSVTTCCCTKGSLLSKLE